MTVNGSTCDLCGATISDTSFGKIDFYTSFGNGRGEHILLDFCLDCFHSEILPLFTERGGTPEIVHYA